MLGKLFDWLDHRTGYKALKDAMLLEHIPGGARWRYVWGSCLAFVFTIQLVTGVMLMWSYSPGDSTAWGSVYFIQYEMDFGWLIRGLHHFGSQTMVVLLGVHMLQVVLAGAHLAPREFNWWLGLGLMGVVLGLSLTGYLLPWDQKGYFATQVSTNILGNTPLLGPFLQRVVVGGPEYGHHTLTHFYALHTGVLPPLLIVLVIAHLAVFRRHGVTAPANAQGMDYFWPAQAFRDLVMCLIVFGVMLGLVILGGHGNEVKELQPGPDAGLYERWAKAGANGLGANLDAPADRLTSSYPARPEWYFLFLFQLLKYFKGEQEIIGTLVIPNGVMVLLFLLPLFGYGKMRKFGHWLGVVAVVSLLLGVGFLTFLAMEDDSPNALLPRSKEKQEAAQQFNDELVNASKQASRAVQLAAQGIPEEGARYLLRNDPLTQGPKLFASKCASCHNYGPPPVKAAGDKQEDFDKKLNDYKEKPGSNLEGYGTYDWIRGLLHNPADPKYFGNIKGTIKGEDGKDEVVKMEGMINWRKKLDNKRKKLDAKEIAEQEKAFDDIAKFLSEQRKPKEKRDKSIDEKQVLEAMDDHCFSCHTFDAKKRKTAPDLGGYGSAEWIRLMVMAPSNSLRYGDSNLMPAFRPVDGPSAKESLQEFLTAHPTTAVIELADIDREIIIRWLIGDMRVVFGGQPISGAAKKD